MYSERNRTDRFIDNWKHNPLLKTAALLAALVIVHSSLLWFKNPGIGLIGWLRIWLDMLNGCAGVGIMSLGMMFVIICGGIDLSAGAMAAAAGAVVVLAADAGAGGILRLAGINGTAACVIAVCAGLLFGALGIIAGIVIAHTRIPPYIATLGMMMIYSGFSGQAMNGASPAIPEGLGLISRHRISGEAFLPVIYWLVLALIFHIILKRTIFGKYVTAAGSNEKAAWIAGIGLSRLKYMVYMISGMTAAAAAVIHVSAAGSPDSADASFGYTIEAVAACVLGGARLGGGRGFISGAVMGTLIAALINNLLSFSGLSPYMSEACKGAIVIAAVIYQRSADILEPGINCMPDK